MMKKMTIFVMLALLAGCIKENHAPLADEDARLVTLLNQADSCKTDGNHGQCFRIYQQIAEEYEQKNLTDLQKRYLQKMLTEAEAVGTSDPRRGAMMKAEALQQMATALMVGGQLDSALMAAHDACRIAPRDTIDFCAQTLLLLAQIHLMNDAGDSVVFYIEKAERTDPAVRHTDLYRITRLYGLDLQHRYADVRFCCLLMMRVPNALLADVYGIAPSSVAVRKQRMKKKLDNDVQNQTIENYLNQYIK